MEQNKNPEKTNHNTKFGSMPKPFDQYGLATTPIHGIVEVASIMEKIPKHYKLTEEELTKTFNVSEKMEAHYWVARLLGEMYTLMEICELAIKQGRRGIRREFVASVRDHAVWREAIKKFRVNWLINIYTDIPLANTKVRLRELTEMYYKLMGKYPGLKCMATLEPDGRPRVKVYDPMTDGQDQNNVEVFDQETAEIKVEHSEDKGHKVNISKKNRFPEAAKILEQIRVELVNADESMMDTSEYMQIIRECGFKTFDV